MTDPVPLPPLGGDAVSSLPFLVGYHPGPGSVGWIASGAGTIRDVGVIPPAVRFGDPVAVAWYFLQRLDPIKSELDQLILTGYHQSENDVAGRAVLEAVAAAQLRDGPFLRVMTFEVRDAEYRFVDEEGRADEWQQIPPPPAQVVMAGQVPAASWKEYAQRYEPQEGHGRGEDAPRLGDLQRQSIAALSPWSRYDLSLRTLDRITAATEVDGMDVARLAFLLRDDLVRTAVLHDVVNDQRRVDGLVRAHLVAHPADGSALRGTAAAASYACGTPAAAVLAITEYAGDDPLAAAIARAATHHSPPHRLYENLTRHRWLDDLRLADNLWLNQQLSRTEEHDPTDRLRPRQVAPPPGQQPDNLRPPRRGSGPHLPPREPDGRQP